ncbi:MAG: curli production assembly protein CsgG [Fibrobacteres bacterium]|nr:curli production assembly protein CsgG [Fibrobacterota bacterium]
METVMRTLPSRTGILFPAICFCAGLILSGCATPMRSAAGPGTRAVPGGDATAASPAAKGPKRRVAIVRVEDVSGYGSGQIRMPEDPGILAGDMLFFHLARSGEFMVLGRGGRDPAGAGTAPGDSESGFTGANALVYGTVLEYGIDAGALIPGEPAGKLAAHAKVAVRMMDPLTGMAFYSDTVEADAAQAQGPGSDAGTTRIFRRSSRSANAIDGASLKDRALNAAIASLASDMAASLRSHPWRAGILDVAPGNVVISAGARAGLRPGQELRLIRPGRRFREPSSGVFLELPGDEVGRIKVLTQYGTGNFDDVSVCAIVRGDSITRADRVELGEGL